MNIKSLVLGFWQGISFGTKFFLVTAYLLWFLGCIFGHEAWYWMINDPSDVINHYELQRLIFCVFAQGSLLHLIFSTFVFNDLVKIEKRLGTVLFIYEILLKNTISQTIYILICVLCYFIGVNPGQSHGLWNIVIYFLALRLLIYYIKKIKRQYSHPNEIYEIVIIKIPLSLRHYFFMNVIILVLNNLPGIDIMCFILLASIEYFFQCRIFRLTKSMIEFLEKSILFRNYQSRQDFIIVDLAEDLIFQGVQNLNFFSSDQNTLKEKKIYNNIEVQVIQEDKINEQTQQNDNSSQELQIRDENFENLNL